MTPGSDSIIRVACLRHVEVELEEGGGLTRSRERNNQAPACSLASNLRGKQRMLSLLPLAQQRYAAAMTATAAVFAVSVSAFFDTVILSTEYNTAKDVRSLPPSLSFSLSRSRPPPPPFAPSARHRVSTLSRLHPLRQRRSINEVRKNRRPS